MMKKSQTLESSSYSLPNGWVWAKIRDIIEKISNGITERQSKENNGIPVTRIETISKSTIDLKKVGYIRNLTSDVTEKYTLHKGDILFSNINSDMHLGKTAIFHRDDVKLIHGMNLLLIRANGKIVQPEFLNYVFNLYRLSGKFISIAQHAVNQSSINQTKLKNMEIPLAPLSEQHRIVSKLEEYFTKLDAGVEALKKTKVLLKRYRQSVLKYAFEGKLTQKWREDYKGEIEPVVILLESLLKRRRSTLPRRSTTTQNYAEVQHKHLAIPNISNLEEIPPSWYWTTIDQLADVVRGASPRPAGHPRYFGGTIPWITVGCITSDDQPYLTHVSEFLTDEGRLKSRYVERDTLLLTNSGATLGVPKITMIDGCINDGSVALLNVDYPLKIYLYYFLSYLTNKLRLINQGAAQPNLNTTIVKAITVPLAPLQEQYKIVEAIEHHFSIIDNSTKIVEQSLKQSQRLNQSMLRMAFEGRLTSQDPSDDPASNSIAKNKKREAK